VFIAKETNPVFLFNLYYKHCERIFEIKDRMNGMDIHILYVDESRIRLRLSKLKTLNKQQF
jgi:hypothetical protein